MWTGNHVWVGLGDTDRYSGTASLVNNVWTQLTAVFESSRQGTDRVRLFLAIAMRTGAASRRALVVISAAHRGDRERHLPARLHAPVRPCHGLSLQPTNDEYVHVA